MPKAKPPTHIKLNPPLNYALVTIPLKLDALIDRLDEIVQVLKGTSESDEVKELRKKLAEAEAIAAEATATLKQSTGELRHAIDEAAAKADQP